MPLTEPNAKTLAAAGLIRAGLADDAHAGVLIIQQNGGSAAGPVGGELEELLIAVTALSVRVLLAANGWDVDRALAVIQQWTDQYAKHPATQRPGPGA
jgi:hypothetical protein